MFGVLATIALAAAGVIERRTRPELADEYGDAP